MRTHTAPWDYQRTPPRTPENDLQLERGLRHLRLCALMGMSAADEWMVAELTGLNDELSDARIRGQIRYLEALHQEAHRGAGIAASLGIEVDNEAAADISNTPHWSDNPKYWAGGE